MDYDIILYKSFYKPLWKYCQNNNFNELNELLKKVNLDLEMKTKEGWNALIISIYHNSYECVKILLNRNANINASNYNGTTVLMYAKENALQTANTKLLDLVLEKGANADHKDVYGKSVLDWLKNEKISLYNHLLKKIKSDK